LADEIIDLGMFGFVLLEWELVVGVQEVSFLDFAIGFGSFDAHGHFG
jgi:hypothetical protein